LYEMGDQILGNGRQLTIGGLARLVSTWHDMLLGDMLCPKHKISDRPCSFSAISIAALPLRILSRCNPHFTQTV
ncbi:hypothetical protein, partial [Cupriavidus nantongensis]|uniref:hypothetical protein n=1 Tax=Cupriavidus nantongensis TaxID=1796606 RepID=UPI00224664D1